MIAIGGCEVVTIGKKADPVIDINQQSPIGAVYLFKAELDSNNISAASRIMAEPNGNKILAQDKYDLYSEMSRLKNKFNKKPITSIASDSLQPDSYAVTMEYDYINTIKFTTLKINNDWFIVGYKE